MKHVCKLVLNLKRGELSTEHLPRFKKRLSIQLIKEALICLSMILSYTKNIRTIYYFDIFSR